jgi:hypothetical protein
VNNDQIKQALLSLRGTGVDFTVVLSGKKSRKVHGLYKAESREIIIHNRNFKNDNEMMYTAIHEYAHHIQFTTSAVPISVRAHTTAYWNLLHTLLFEAEEQGLYENPFERIGEFRTLTRQIREKFLATSGSLMKELGGLLIQAHALCERHGTSFPDYLDRVLAIPRTSAQLIMKANTLDLDARVGFENMRSLARIRDEGDRRRAEVELMEGHSPDMVKTKYGKKKARAGASSDGASPDASGIRAALSAERERIQQAIGRLQKQLKEIEKRLKEIEEE